jgi:hypothetical protein
MLLSLCTSDQSFEVVHLQFITSQDTQTTWYHDCSNTTGFTRVDEWKTDIEITYGEIESDGTSLNFNNITDIEGIHGPIFIYEFSESFQVAAFESFYTDIHIHDTFLDRGQFNIYLADEMQFPVVQTYFLDEANDPDAPWDVYYFHGNKYHSLLDYPDQMYGNSYSDSTISSDVMHNISHHHGQIWSAGGGYGSLGSVSSLDNSRRIKYLVIEHCEYDISEDDVSFSVNEIIVKYNSNTVEEPENFDLYYFIPDSHRWYGYQLTNNSELTGFHLAQWVDHYFYAFVTTGTWKVAISHGSDLELRIDVDVNGSTSTSSLVRGDFPTIDFVVTERTFALIDVVENSVSRETSGYYNISFQYVSSSTDPITSSTTTTTTTAETTTTTSTKTSETSTLTTSTDLTDYVDAGIKALSSALPGITILGILAIVVVSAIFLRKRFLLDQRQMPSYDLPQDQHTVEVQVQDIPEEYQPVHETREIIRTIRLPTHCPNCDSPVIQEGIDWTGPLQAKCSYCGHPIRASFEPI